MDLPTLGNCGGSDAANGTEVLSKRYSNGDPSREENTDVPGKSRITESFEPGREEVNVPAPVGIKLQMADADAGAARRGETTGESDAVKVAEENLGDSVTTTTPRENSVETRSGFSPQNGGEEGKDTNGFVSAADARRKDGITEAGQATEPTGTSRNPQGPVGHDAEAVNGVEHGSEQVNGGKEEDETGGNGREKKAEGQDGSNREEDQEEDNKVSSRRAKEAEKRRRRRKQKKNKKGEPQKEGKEAEMETVEGSKADAGILGDVEVEYISIKPEVSGEGFEEFLKIFEKFNTADVVKAEEEAKEAEEKADKAMKEDSDDEDEERDKDKGMSNKEKKLKRRMKVAELKQICARPDVVEVWDSTAQDPKLLVFLKAYRNTVPVPRHWSQKRKYLQGPALGGFLHPPDLTLGGGGGETTMDQLTGKCLLSPSS